MARFALSKSGAKPAGDWSAPRLHQPPDWGGTQRAGDQQQTVANAADSSRSPLNASDAGGTGKVDYSGRIAAAPAGEFLMRAD
jgi:hypothetical protein